MAGNRFYAFSITLGLLSLSGLNLAAAEIDLSGTWVVKELATNLDGDRYEYSQTFEFSSSGQVETLGASYEFTFDGQRITIASPIPATYKVIKTEGKKSVWESYAGSSKTGYFFIEKQ